MSLHFEACRFVVSIQRQAEKTSIVAETLSTNDVCKLREETRVTSFPGTLVGYLQGNRERYQAMRRHFADDTLTVRRRVKERTRSWHCGPDKKCNFTSAHPNRFPICVRHSKGLYRCGQNSQIFFLVKKTLRMLSCGAQEFRWSLKHLGFNSSQTRSLLTIVMQVCAAAFTRQEQERRRNSRRQ